MAEDYSGVVTGLKCGSPGCIFLALNVRDLSAHATRRHGAEVRGTSCTIRKTVDDTGSTKLAQVGDSKSMSTPIATTDGRILTQIP